MESSQEYATQNVLMLGATGWIGKYILEELIKSKSFNRLAILTSENTIKSKSSQIEHLKAQGVEVIVGDITNLEEISRALKGN